MYRLVSIDSARSYRYPFATSDNLVTLWEMLEAAEYKYTRLAIIDQYGDIRGGKATTLGAILRRHTTDINQFVTK